MTDKGGRLRSRQRARSRSRSGGGYASSGMGQGSGCLLLLGAVGTLAAGVAAAATLTFSSLPKIPGSNKGELKSENVDVKNVKD